MSPNAERGFTLIEILVALAVFAVIALISYRGLDTVLNAKARVDTEMRFWRDVGLVFDRIETDFSQISTVNRIDTSGKLRPPLRAGNLADQLLFEMTRFDGAREPVHVAYRLREQKLELLLWKFNAKGEEVGTPDVHLLIDNIEACRLSYLDSKGAWSDKWPATANESRPQGVRIELQVAGRGTFERMFALL